MGRKLGKVYRDFYGEQPTKYEGMDTTSLIPKFFKRPCSRDVSDEYFSYSAPIRVEMPEESEWAYLSVYNGQRYIPIDIAPVDTCGIATFANVESGIILFPSIATEQEIIPSGYPVLTDTMHSRIMMPHTDSLTSLTLTRKYPHRTVFRMIMNMLGSKIEASADTAFSRPIKVKDLDDMVWRNHIEIPCAYTT